MKTQNEAQPPNVPRPDRFLDRLGWVAMNYDHFADRAKAGDVEAALELSSVLRTCSQSPLTPASLEDYIKQAAVDYPRDSPDYASRVSFLTSEYEQCSRFSRAQIDERRTWLTIAAASGDTHAKILYVDWARPDDSRSDTYLQDTRDFVANSRRYLADAIAAGDPSALMVASLNYGGEGAGVFDPDPIMEYAYLYAYCLAQECRPMNFAVLSKLGAGLSPHELSNATSQGQTIYRQCCAK